MQQSCNYSESSSPRLANYVRLTDRAVDLIGHRFGAVERNGSASTDIVASGGKVNSGMVSRKVRELTTMSMSARSTLRHPFAILGFMAVVSAQIAPPRRAT